MSAQNLSDKHYFNAAPYENFIFDKHRRRVFGTVIYCWQVKMSETMKG